MSMWNNRTVYVLIVIAWMTAICRQQENNWDCGRSTANNKYPWIVAIYDEKEEIKCTGTIISAYHVVTNEKCFHYSSVHDLIHKIEHKYIKQVPNYTIVAGKHYSNLHRTQTSGQIRKIKNATIGSTTVTSVGWIHASDIALIEVDNEFDFANDVQPACIDWDDFYEKKDFSEGNEALAVDWTYNKDEIVPCQDANDFNVQIWDIITCTQNTNKIVFSPVSLCGTYINSNRSSCGKSLGTGLFFKSSPWRYYLRGISRKIVTEPEVTYGLYTMVSLFLPWLRSQMITHPHMINLFYTMGVLKDEVGCKLPNHVKYGRFKLVFGEAFRPGAWVPTRTRILLTCTADAGGKSVSTYCNLDKWQPPVDQLECKRPGTCSALSSSSSEDIICRNNGQTVDCTEPGDNTTAVIRCKPFYAIPGNKPIYKCEGGEWDQPFTHCTLECGTKRVGATTLVVGGSEVIQNEYPWVVAVYQRTKQICGGTIISKSYVLSAAHCFTRSNGTAKDKELYTIFAGKHYRNFSAEESSAQSRKIKALHIYDDYRGVLQKYRDDIALIELDAELIPSLEVQPACLDWENVYEDFDFIDGNKAVVAGWGYTTQGGPSSDVLKKLVVPFRSKDVCVASLPKEFSHQFLVEDKICAGDRDSNMNVCKGDSGGGLYFQSDDKRFYVRGIVSLVPKTTTNTCEINKFALYIKVSKYLPWIETIVRRVL